MQITIKVTDQFTPAIRELQKSMEDFIAFTQTKAYVAGYIILNRRGRNKLVSIEKRKQ